MSKIDIREKLERAIVALDSPTLRLIDSELIMLRHVATAARKVLNDELLRKQGHEFPELEVCLQALDSSL